MAFYDILFEENRKIWDECYNSEFLTKLADGTLGEECFKGYIVDDSLYLRECRKVFAWGMTKANTMSEVKTYYSLMSFVNESEVSTRIKYLEKYGLTDSQIEILPQRAENLAYTQTMIDAAQNGEGGAECMVALMPCMASYWYIFDRMAKEKPQVKETVYWPLVRDYADESYKDAIDGWIAMLNDFCANLTPEREEKLMGLFRKCSLHELSFWNMSKTPRKDV